jgi:putative hydrolase of the HAD superfamily
MLTAIFSKRTRAVTFDCWATLIHEVDPRPGGRGRAELLAKFTGVDEIAAAAALSSAWRRHQVEWHRRVVFAGPHMTADALERLGLELSPERARELVTLLEDEILTHDIRAIDGAHEVLAALRDAGIRRALICDTGFSPGRVVRRLLDRVGLLDLLEATVFSNEIGVPKPHSLAFTTALASLGVAPEHAVHVGDLRRSDVAGARAAGMGTVRFRGSHDDSDAGLGANAGVIDCTVAGCTPPCGRPEADVVIDAYPALRAMITDR